MELIKIGIMKTPFGQNVFLMLNGEIVRSKYFANEKIATMFAMNLKTRIKDQLQKSGFEYTEK